MKVMKRVQDTTASQADRELRARLDRECCSQVQTALEISVPDWTFSRAALESARYLHLPRVISTTLFRSAPDGTPPLPKHCYVGEVGWGLQYSTALNRPTVNKLYELDRFQSAVQDEVTHSPRQNQSQFQDKQPTCGKLARNHSAYDTYSEDNNKQFPLNQ